jgi:hypothetical protein
MLTAGRSGRYRKICDGSTEIQSFFVTKPYNPSFHSPVKTQNFQPFFVWLKILLSSAMKIKVFPRKPCFQQKRGKGMKMILKRFDNPVNHKNYAEPVKSWFMPLGGSLWARNLINSVAVLVRWKNL